jgi:hypothetical protein
MSVSILENELFTELSDQQQEMTIGGIQGIHKNVNTCYNTNAIHFINQNGSGPGGSFVNTGIEQAEIKTGSSENLNANFC